MDFSIYAAPRKFALPRLNRTEYVGGEAVLWALLSGPIFFWRKGALIEAMIVSLATLPFWAIDTDGYLVDALGALVWLGTGALAPVLLAANYRRRGWVDVSDGRPARHRDDERENDAARLAAEENDGLLVPPRRGRRLLDLEDDPETGDEAPPARPAPEDHERLALPPRGGRRLLDLEDEPDEPPVPAEDDGLILPPHRGRLLDIDEADLD